MRGIILFMICICSKIGLAQWSVIESGTDVTLHDVYFPTDSIGYIIGGDGMNSLILKTTNGGRKWEVIGQNEQFNFQTFFNNEIYFFDEENGLVVASNYSGHAIYRTRDGGLSWESDTIPALDKINDLDHVGNTLFLTGSGKLYKSTDMAEWTILYQNDSVNFTHTSFTDSAHGYAQVLETGDFSVYRTENGGQAWYPIGAFSNFVENYSSLIFEDTLIGLSGGWYQPHLMKTDNGGYNWQALNIDNGQMPTIYFIAISDNTVYAGGEKMFCSDDRGGSWNKLSLPEEVTSIHDLYLFNEETGIAVGDNGIILRLDQTISVNDPLLVKKIKIYPNPTKGKINIEIPYGMYLEKVEVFNSKGKKVREFKGMFEKMAKFDVSDLRNGQYTVKVKTDKEISDTTKLIIHKNN